VLCTLNGEVSDEAQLPYEIPLAPMKSLLIMTLINKYISSWAIIKASA
jgi:hypothetical protein